MTQENPHRPTPEELEDLFANVEPDKAVEEYLGRQALAALEKKKKIESDLSQEASRQWHESQQWPFR
jgi:hypothetical protein